MVGAIILTHLCTKYGLPISVSHSLIGGLAGAALVKAGFDALVTSGLMKVAIFIVLSPIIGLILGASIMIIVNWSFRNANSKRVDKLFRIGQLLSSAAFSLGYGTNDAQKTILAGIPVSTTHTIAGAIMDVGSTRRLSAVRWGIAGKIVWAWVLTIPTSAAIGGLTYLIVSQFL